MQLANLPNCFVSENKCPLWSPANNKLSPEAKWSFFLGEIVSIYLKNLLWSFNVRIKTRFLIDRSHCLGTKAKKIFQNFLWKGYTFRGESFSVLPPPPTRAPVWSQRSIIGNLLWECFSARFWLGNCWFGRNKKTKLLCNERRK